MKKYTLEQTDHVTPAGAPLFRVVRCSDGTRGGLIEKESNLSHEGACWVSGDAQVYGDAWVSGDARVYGNAQVYGDAWVYGDA